MGLELTVSQVQTLSPQVIQSLEVLQMNTQELLDYVRELALENPVVEVSPPDVPAAPARSRSAQQMEWLESTDRQNRWYNRQDNGRDEVREASLGVSTDEPASLAEYVRSQLPAQTGAMARAVRFLTDCLDQNGWIPEGLEQLSAESRLPLPVMERALAQIQSVEPWGVGARNLQECLLIQLQHRRDADDLTAEIVRHYLPELAKNHYNGIAKALRTTQAQVRRAADQIRSLNPRPGNGFAQSEPTGYILPDLVAEPGREGMVLRLSEGILPRLNISGYYLELRKNSADPALTEYLDQKVQQARWAVSAITQRQDTMLKCMEAIVALQPGYFSTARGPLCPMTLSDVAARVGVHESTVSRAIRGKYLQCPDGIVPLSFFFSQSAFQSGQGAEAVSVTEAKRRLRELLMGEDQRRPYSDQRLSELMGEQGCPISRRTVAKYRSELGFPPATGRKRS